MNTSSSHTLQNLVGDGKASGSQGINIALGGGSQSSCWNRPECVPATVNVEFEPVVQQTGFGTSFLKMFHGGFSNGLFIPKGYVLEDNSKGELWFNITCGVVRSYRVLLQHYGSKQVLTKGWADLVIAERIEQGDIGFFKRTGALELELTVHNKIGVQKHQPSHNGGTLIRRPEQVPWEAVRFTLAPSANYNKDLKTTLHAVWMASPTPNMLYGVTLKRNHIARCGMIFTKKLSDSLPFGCETVPLALFFNGSGHVMAGNMKKRLDGILRITQGWFEFARAHRLEPDRNYVFRFGCCLHGWQLTVFQA